MCFTRSFLEFPFNVFHSHKWGKNSSVHELVKQVFNWLQPELRGFVDSEQMPSGTHLSTCITQAIRDCQFLFVYVTTELIDDYNRSFRLRSSNKHYRCSYVFMEIDYAMSVNTRIFLIVLEKPLLKTANWKGQFGKLFSDYLHFSLVDVDLSNPVTKEKVREEILDSLRAIIDRGLQPVLPYKQVRANHVVAKSPKRRRSQEKKPLSNKEYGNERILAILMVVLLVGCLLFLKI